MTDARAVFEAAGNDGGLPMVFTNGRQLSAVVDDAVAALVASNDPPRLFVRGGLLTRLRADESGYPMLEAAGVDEVRLYLSRAATWWRRMRNENHVAVSPPVDVARSILAAHDWPLPALAGVVELPVLRPDGTFHVSRGYDAATRMHHWHAPGIVYPEIPEAPTTGDLHEAVQLVDDMFCDFPWDTTADRANAWALLLTPFVRPLVTHVPMALVDAPEPGTGKSLLVRMMMLVTTGRTGAAMSWPAHEEELEKKVTAALMAGATSVIFDNVEGTIRSQTLAAVLTADAWGGRILGSSTMVMVPNRATWVATGNNIDVGGDLARRCYRIRLDARMAAPYTRDGFAHDLDEWVPTNRGRLVGAICTIIRSWVCAGRHRADTIAAMGGFTPWVRTLGGILEHAGVSGLLANLAEFHASADRESAQWEGFLGAWHDAWGDNGVRIAEVIALMDAGSTVGTDMRDAMPDELAGYWSTPSFSRRLGQQCRKRTGRHYGAEHLHLVELPSHRSKVALWSVAMGAEAAPADPQANRSTAPPRVEPDPAASQEGWSDDSLF
jgi:hypothetical protein